MGLKALWWDTNSLSKTISEITSVNSTSKLSKNTDMLQLHCGNVSEVHKWLQQNINTKTGSPLQKAHVAMAEIKGTTGFSTKNVNFACLVFHCFGRHSYHLMKHTLKQYTLANYKLLTACVRIKMMLKRLKRPRNNIQPVPTLSRLQTE